MAGCGYVCPVCEGRGFMESGKECDYCSLDKREKSKEVACENSQKLDNENNSSHE